MAASNVGSNMNGDGAGRLSFLEQMFEIVEMSREFVRLTVDKYLLNLWLSCSIRSIVILLGSLVFPAFKFFVDCVTIVVLLIKLERGWG